MNFTNTNLPKDSTGSMIIQPPDPQAWEREWKNICYPLADSEIDHITLRIFQEKSWNFIADLLSKTKEEERERYRQRLREAIEGIKKVIRQPIGKLGTAEHEANRLQEYMNGGYNQALDEVIKLLNL